MIRAAASGRLDYTCADSDDALWILKERMMLKEEERLSVLAMEKAKHLQMVATCQWPEGDKKGDIYKHHFSSGTKILESLEKLLLPYDKITEKEYYKREMEDMRKEYTRVFGDPSSPEAKARAQADSARILQQRAASKQKMLHEMETKRKQAQELSDIRNRKLRRSRGNVR